MKNNCNIECKETLCVFNGNDTCIRNSIVIKSDAEAYCSSKCLATVDELKRLKDYYYNSLINDIKDALAQEKFKRENLEKQIDAQNKEIAELKKTQATESHKTTAKILNKAREKAHPIKDKTLKNMFSLSDLEDMYIEQGLSLRAMSEITGIAKTTLYNRLKAAGITDKRVLNN